MKPSFQIIIVSLNLLLLKVSIQSILLLLISFFTLRIIQIGHDTLHGRFYQTRGFEIDPISALHTLDHISRDLILFSFTHMLHLRQQHPIVVLLFLNFLHPHILSSFSPQIIWFVLVLPTALYIIFSTSFPNFVERISRLWGNKSYLVIRVVFIME